VVQAVNFDRNGSAGCNIYGILGNDTLFTDNSWKVAKGIIAPDKVDSASLSNAVPYDNGWKITAPDFSLGLRSWIER